MTLAWVTILGGVLGSKSPAAVSCGGTVPVNGGTVMVAPGIIDVEPGKVTVTPGTVVTAPGIVTVAPGIVTPGEVTVTGTVMAGLVVVMVIVAVPQPPRTRASNRRHTTAIVRTLVFMVTLL